MHLLIPVRCVRAAGIALTYVLLSACASSDIKPACPVGLRAEAPEVEDRLLAAHPGVQPVEVLKCVAEPSGTGFNNPDDEACLVRVAPGLAESVDRSYDPGTLNAMPDVVRVLSWGVPRLTSAALNESKAAVYRTADPELVILYAPSVRCAVFGQVTR
jgi:hypothetical protein